MARAEEVTLRERVLGYLAENASVYPDDSRLVYAVEIADALGLERRGKERVVGVLVAAQRRGEAWRTPGPGTGGWISRVPPASPEAKR